MLMEFLVPGETIWNVFSLIGFLTIYVIVTTFTFLLIAQLIIELGVGAMNCLGVTFGALSTQLNVDESAVSASDVGIMTMKVRDQLELAGRGAYREATRAISGMAGLICGRIGRIRGTGGS